MRSHPVYTSDTNLLSINVYFNAFRIRYCFRYKSGVTRTIGNTIGATQSFSFDEGKRIFAVYITSYVQKLPKMSLPRDTVAVEGLRVSLSSWSYS